MQCEHAFYPVKIEPKRAGTICSCPGHPSDPEKWFTAWFRLARGSSPMMALRLPFVSRLMIFEVRFEQLCSRTRIPVLVSERTLQELLADREARRRLVQEQVELERQRLFAGSFRLR
jgi:hypothetical protein